MTDSPADSASPRPSVTRERYPIVFLHGYLGGPEQWAAEDHVLSEEFSVILPNLPGFANRSSESPPDSIRGFAEDVIRQVDAHEIPDFALVGHSMGGMIAQELARMVPDRITKLVLYGTGPLGNMPDRFETLEESLRLLARDGVVTTARRIAATWLVQGERDPSFPLLCEIGAKASADAAEVALRAMADWDGRNALAEIRQPTTVVWGDRDRSYRWHQVNALWSGLPDASLAVIPQASHAAHLEKPKIFHAIIFDSLRRAEP